MIFMVDQKIGTTDYLADQKNQNSIFSWMEENNNSFLTHLT